MPFFSFSGIKSQVSTRLRFPPLDATISRDRLAVGLKKPPPLPPWPWRETTLTAANCTLLWVIAWLQFLVMRLCFAFNGRNLWFYALEPPTFGLTIPETFLAFSIALSVFAIVAVAAGTRGVPRLWKRLFTVGLFAFFAIGLSLVNLHLRHYSYRQALFFREQAQASYHRQLVLHYDSSDSWEIQRLEWRQELVEDYDREIRRYREKYGLAPDP